MIANLLPSLQLSTVDYGGCVMLYRLPVGYGKAEIRCYGRGGTPPRVKRYWLGKRYAGCSRPRSLFSVSPQKSINSKQLASNLPAVSYTNPYPRFSITRQLPLG